MATVRRGAPVGRKERQRDIPDPQVPPQPPKGKRGSAAKTTIARSKEPLKATRKVKR
jgi:hypothetical protein